MAQPPPALTVRRWRVVLRVAVSVAGLAVLLHSIDISEVTDVVDAAEPGWLLLAILVGVLAQLTPLWQWALLLPPHPELRAGRLTGLFLRATFVSHLLPSGIGGDAVRSLELGGTLGYGNAVASVAAGRLLGMLAMAGWAFAGSWLLAGFGVLPETITAAVLIGLLLLSGLALGADHVRPTLLPRRRRLATFLDEMTAGLAAYRHRRGQLAAAAGVSILGFGLNIVSMLFLAHAIGLSVGWPLLAVGIPLAMAVTLLPITVNGIGVREGVLVGLLVHAGAGLAAAAAMALYADLQAFPLAVFGALLSALRRRARVLAGSPIAEQEAEGALLSGG